MQWREGEGGKFGALQRTIKNVDTVFVACSHARITGITFTDHTPVQAGTHTETCVYNQTHPFVGLKSITKSFYDTISEYSKHVVDEFFPVRCRLAGLPLCCAHRVLFKGDCVKEGS